MQRNRGHEHVFNAAALMPGESLGQFARRHNIFVWDVLVLNWDRLRQPEFLQHYSGHLLASPAQATAGMACLNATVKSRAWHDDLPSLLSSPWLPDTQTMEQICLDLDGVVLDARPPKFCPAFYANKRHRPDLNCAGFQHPSSAVPGSSAVLEPVDITLYVVGHSAASRLNDMLTDLNVPSSAVCRCMLHCMLAIIK